MIPQPKFTIDQRVFSATSNWTEVHEQCPDCLGTKEWQVKTPAGEEFTLPCNTCYHGYNQSEGFVRVWKDASHVRELTIGSVRMDTSDKEHIFSYMCKETGVGSGNVYYEENLFLDKEAAEKRAKELTVQAIKQREKQEQAIIEKKKSRPKPTWQEKRIKELEKQLKALSR